MNAPAKHIPTVVEEYSVMAKRGRPRKAGPRYPSGQRKTPGPQKKGLTGKPTEEMLAKRRELLGKPDAKVSEMRAAENPLDCMVARGWLEPSLAHAGHALAELYRRAGLSPGRVTASIEEAPESAAVDARRVSDMTPDEIAEIWRVLEQRLGDGPAGMGDEDATAKLKMLWTDLGRAITSELYSVCVLNSWPMWLAQKIGGRDDNQIATKWMHRRDLLVAGLRVVHTVVFKTKERPAEPARDHPFLSGPVIEEELQYVDEEGNPDPVTNRAGAAVTVIRRRRA